jgi:hypothetical protein
MTTGGRTASSASSRTLYHQLHHPLHPYYPHHYEYIYIYIRMRGSSRQPLKHVANLKRGHRQGRSRVGTPTNGIFHRDAEFICATGTEHRDMEHCFFKTRDG